MNSIAFSLDTLTESQAKSIAEAYVRGDKDPPTMARILGVDSFDLNLIMHPLTRRFIVLFQREARAEYSLTDHLSMLKKIRDAAFDDENWKIALSAETQLGKAAGHYDPKPMDPEDPGSGGGMIDVGKMSTTELRRQLAKTIGAVIPQKPAELEDNSDEEDGLA
jgi:hypothetical protein